jgi:DNA-binding NarL/FixJ family response regulator
VSNQTIRIVVVDDHALFRAGLISLLSKTAGIEVVGEGGSGHEAIKVVKETRPDIVLLDVNMPVMDGIETVKRIKGLSECRILMLTISKRQEDLVGAIRAGADGYILKNADPNELYKAIQLAVEGKSILSPEITNQVMYAVRTSSVNLPNTHNLTPRELEVLNLLSSGKTNPQISKTLHISENTVKTHVRNLMEKLGAATRTEAVSNAIHLGILRP